MVWKSLHCCVCLIQTKEDFAQLMTRMMEQVGGGKVAVSALQTLSLFLSLAVEKKLMHGAHALPFKHSTRYSSVCVNCTSVVVHLILALHCIVLKWSTLVYDSLVLSLYSMQVPQRKSDVGFLAMLPLELF